MGGPLRLPFLTIKSIVLGLLRSCVGAILLRCHACNFLSFIGGTVSQQTSLSSYNFSTLFHDVLRAQVQAGVTLYSLGFPCSMYVCMYVMSLFVSCLVSHTVEVSWAWPDCVPIDGLQAYRRDALTEDPVWFSAPMWWLSTLSNSSSRNLTLLFPPWAPDIHVMHISTRRPSFHTQICVYMDIYLVYCTYFLSL